jgi:hypothetical protein
MAPQLLFLVLQFSVAISCQLSIVIITSFVNCVSVLWSAFKNQNVRSLIAFFGIVKQNHQNVVYVSTFTQRVAGGPGHFIGRGPRCGECPHSCSSCLFTIFVVGDPLRSRLGPLVYENGRSYVQHSRESEKFCCNLFSGHLRST